MLLERKREKRILHVIIGLEVGGAERALFRLIESHKNSAEFTHTVIVLTSVGTIGERIANSGVAVFPMGLQGLWSTPVVLYKVYKKIRGEAPDIVQCWMYHGDLIGGIAAKLARTKMVLWGIRNSELEGGGTLQKKIIRKTCAYLSWIVPDRIICVAQSAMRVHRSVGYDHRRMEVITNGYELQKFSFSPQTRSQIRRRLGIDNYIVVGSVGRYSKAKDHATFIEAASKALDSNSNLRFLLLGRGVDEGNPYLGRLINATGKHESFILLGECQDVAGYMSAMDVFCLHSITEGFPNVLGEAMSVGLPCITTDVGDARYLLDDNGIVVSSGDSLALSNAIIKMTSADKAQLTALGNKGKKRVVDKFSLESAVKKFERIYEGV